MSIIQHLSIILLPSLLKAAEYKPAAIRKHDAGISVMTKDPYNKMLIAGDAKGFIYFYSLSGGELIVKIKVHEAEVKQLRFNSTGKLLISATSDGEIKIVDIDKQKVIQGLFSPDYFGINFVLFSIADGFIYFNGNNKLYKTRSDLSQIVNTVLSVEDTITDAVITSDRSAIIFSTSNKLKVLSTRSDRIIQDISAGVSKIRRIGLVGDTLLATWADDGSISLWHYRIGQLDSQPVFGMRGGQPSQVSFSDDGKFMTSGNIGTWARIWKPLEKSIVQELFAHTGTVTGTLFGINNNQIFTCSKDGQIILWRSDTLISPESKKEETLVKKEEELERKSAVIAESKKDSLISLVEMKENNVPATIANRKVAPAKEIVVRRNKVTIYVYDNSFIDGDTISLFFNGNWILDRYGVTKKKRALEVKLLPNTNNYLVLFANNLGKTPPNTATVEIDDGESRKIYRLSSDLKACSAVNFVYRP